MQLFARTLPELIKTYWEQIKRHRFITNAGAYVSGYMLQKAVSFLLVPLWARFLTPDDYGITGTLLAYSGVLSTLLAMGLHGAAVRHYYDYTDKPVERKRYASSIILFQSVVPGIVVLALNGWGPWLWARFTANTIPFDPYVRIMLWSTYVDVLIQIPLALYQAEQKAQQYVYVQYGRFVLGVLASLALVVGLRLGAHGVLLSQLLAGSLVTASVLYLATRTWFTPGVAWHYVREGLAFGLPLVPHALASWILQAADRLIMERFVSLTEIGLYNFGYTLGMAMQFLVVGVNQAWSPHYFRLMQSDPEAERKIIRAVSIYVALIGGVCLIGVLFAGEIVQILMPASFYGAVPYIAPVVGGYLLLGFYYFASAPLFYYKKTTLIPLLTGFSAIVNVGANLWLVPRYGAIAAAWITLVSYGILFLLAFVVGRRFQALDYPLGKYLLLVAMTLFGTVISARLGIFELSALLIKLALIMVYTGIAYFGLIKPMTERQHG